MRKIFLGKKWFFEEFLPGEPQTSDWGFEIEKEVFSQKSKFQKIEIFETKEFGRVLALDGIIQLSTKYEFIYHEMLVHPAMLYSQNLEKILIIGGGDGGVLREAVKYPAKEIILVDIDEKVIESSKRYLPSVSKGAFKDKRLKIFNKDALNFLKEYKNYFDIIINDLTDPIGPSFSLWKAEFYRDIFAALKEDGLVAFQTEYLRERVGKGIRKRLKRFFPFLKTHKAFVDCFPFGEFTFSFASKKIDFDKISFKKVSQKFKKAKVKTKYYSPKIHFASKVLPEYLEKKYVNH